MIGSRKVQGQSELGVEDIAFYYEEMVKSHLLELEVQTPGGKIALKRLNRESRSHPMRRRTDFLLEDAFDASIHAAPSGSPYPSSVHHLKTINSPIIGVFYRASSPQSAAFVKEGDIVDIGTTVCIVEAMKVMNEIKADCRCRIVKILVENAKPITKDEPLFHVDPLA